MQYEEVFPLVHATGLNKMGWDALGQALFVDLETSHLGHTGSFQFSLNREAATRLLCSLAAYLEETGGATPLAQ